MNPKMLLAKTIAICKQNFLITNLLYFDCSVDSFDLTPVPVWLYNKDPTVTPYHITSHGILSDWQTAVLSTVITLYATAVKLLWKLCQLVSNLKVKTGCVHVCWVGFVLKDTLICGTRGNNSSVFCTGWAPCPQARFAAATPTSSSTSWPRPHTANIRCVGCRRRGGADKLN